ncbi:MAG: TonB-dependent receptor [Marinilabilia sp.]
MRKFLIFIGLTFFSAQMFSQHELNGVVYTEDEQPLTGATVMAKPGNYGTVTDGEGQFKLTGLPGNELKLTISFLGYKKWEETIDPSETTDLRIIMEPRSQLTEEVVVTAYRAGNKTPVAHTDLGGEELRSTGTGSDIPSLLKLTPSLVTTSESGTGLGYTNFRIRGTDPTRINVTMNGIPINDSESQGVFWANMPDFANSVENVQVQRGIGTTSQGPAAFGATVNFRTTTSDPKPYAELNSTAGSFNTYKNSVRMGTGLINDQFSFEGRYSRLNSDGYIHNAFSDHQSLYLGGTMHFTNSFLKMILLHGDQQTGISWWGVPEEVLDEDRRYNPAGEYTDEFGNEQYYDDQTDNYKQTHAQLFYSFEASENMNFTAALHYTVGDGFYEQYREDEAFSNYGLPDVNIGDQTIESTDLIRRKWLGNDFYGFTFSGNITPIRGVEISAGGGWNQYDGDHFGNLIWMRHAGNTEKEYEWYFNNGLKTDYNLFSKLSLQISPAVTAFADLQYRGISYELSGNDDDLLPLVQQHDYGFFNPKTGIYVAPGNNHQFYVFGGITHREPTRTNFKEAKGDPEATPQSERLYDVEIGHDYQSSVFSSGINFYYMHYKDQLVPTGEKSSVGNDIMTNVPESYRAGIEVTGAIKPASWLKWDMNMTFSRNIIRNYVETAVNYDENWEEELITEELGDTEISYSPSLTGSSKLTAELHNNLKTSVISKYVGEQFFDNTESEDRKLDAYFVNDLQVEYSIFPDRMDKIDFQLTVHNVLDHLYESNAYGGNWYEQGEEKTWAYYYPMAGRYYMGKVVIRF